jgi:hypothetical protein
MIKLNYVILCDINIIYVAYCFGDLIKVINDRINYIC